MPKRYSSVQFSHSVVSDSLQPHESQHARSPCPSPTPAVHTDSRPLSQWHHPAISFSAVPFSSYLQSLPASESFPMSPLRMSTGVSALAWVTREVHKYWNGQLIPSPGNLPDPGIELGSPAFQADSLPAELPERSLCLPNTSNFKLRHRRTNSHQV